MATLWEPWQTETKHDAFVNQHRLIGLARKLISGNIFAKYKIRTNMYISLQSQTETNLRGSKTALSIVLTHNYDHRGQIMD